MATTKRGCPSHPQQTMQSKPPGEPYKCSGCQVMGFGRSYHCENKNCSYILHEECRNADSVASHRFFPKSSFKFYEEAQGDRYCDACIEDVKGFVYHCSRTGYDLHPCCLKLKDRISDEEGLVTLELSEKVPKKCFKCKHKNVVDNNVKGWSYVSSPGSGGSYCYHVSCVKELIVEKLKDDYFSQKSNSDGMSDREFSQLALRSMEIVERRGRSRRSGTIKKYTKIAVVVFKLIFSAIFGNPISAIAALVEALADSD